MHKKFDSEQIEKKWQKEWTESGIYDVGARNESKEKEYVLVEWPYPSGNLHIGHWYAFAVPDIYVRYGRMKGKQVIYPMGFDAFGLPAENAAIKRNINPREWTEQNIAYMKGQLTSMGNAFSWDKTASSADPEYYKWTQWMFTEFFRNDIAYRGVGVVNWCPGCNTVIANEQVLADGTCERSGDVIEKKEMPQWMIRITDFADALVDDLDALDWPEHIKDAQRNWIGRSEGAEIDFQLKFTGECVEEKNAWRSPEGKPAELTVFTTRPDTLFGATYMVVAPDHAWVTAGLEYKLFDNPTEIEAYRQATAKKDEQDRLDNTKEKTGVKLEGVVAINPANGEEIPVYIADYVLAGYGTGAIMAVPAHDERDFAFAEKFGIPIKQVIVPVYQENALEKHSSTRQAVYGLIKNAEGKYLIQHYTNKDFYWIPGGGVDEGEYEIDCLKRELLEETGYLNTKIENKIGTFFYDYLSLRTNVGQTRRNYCQIFKVTLENTEQQAVEYTEAEITDGLTEVWLSREEIAKLTSKIQPERIQLILEAIDVLEGVVIKKGALLNSGEFDGMDSEDAKKAIVEKVGGRMTNTYRLRDWSIGRQRYWGVPIPIVYDPEGVAHPVPKEHLPWTLPEDVDFTPTGEPPLAKSAELKKRTEDIFGEGWTPEVETMDTFVDSSWYFLRYIDNKNDESLASAASQREWMPVDLYFGGAEHTTMHVLYSRFWQKALHKLGLATEKEPYTRRINRSLILGPDGNKMSKSKGNVIDPDEQVARVGADTVKMYLAFMGPYGEMSNYPWDMGGIAGLRRFLERVNGLSEHIVEEEGRKMTTLLHKTTKKVSEDIVVFKFNTAISAMMVYVNAVEKEGVGENSYKNFLRLLAPFAPYLTEELWTEAGNSSSIHAEEFPTYDPALAKDEAVIIGVQINGKVRGDIELSPEATEEEALALALQNENVQKWLEGKDPKKVIYRAGKILNLVV